jgi:hypothetical protein
MFHRCRVNRQSQRHGNAKSTAHKYAKLRRRMKWRLARKNPL